MECSWANFKDAAFKPHQESEVDCLLEKHVRAQQRVSRTDLYEAKVPYRVHFPALAYMLSSVLQALCKAKRESDRNH